MRSSLGQALEPLEGVVDEDPVLVAVGRVVAAAVVVVAAAAAALVVVVVSSSNDRKSEIHLGKVVKVGSVIYRPKR